MYYWNTVNELLKDSLLLLMQKDEFASFRLVGGTALSLHLGHRMSIDIDLFTEEPYRSIDFKAIESCLRNNFPYVYGDFGGNHVMGKSYLIGSDKDNVIKLDTYYSMDPFFQPLVDSEGIRMATVEEIIAMKIDVVRRGGRKKDFWDLHELLDRYPISKMIDLHRLRFEWTHDEALIRENFTNFSNADLDLNPICLRGKEWTFIKEDLQDALAVP